MRRFSLLNVLLLVAVAALSVALFTEKQNGNALRVQIEELEARTFSIAQAGSTDEIKLRQHFQLPPYVFKYSILPPANSKYRLCVAVGRSDSTELNIEETLPLETDSDGLCVVSVAFSKNGNQWVRRISPGGKSLTLLSDSLDWIQPLAHITSGGTLPEYGETQTFSSGRVYLAMLIENNDMTHPAVIESNGRSVFTAGPFNRKNKNPGNLMAIWVEPVPPNDG